MTEKRYGDRYSNDDVQAVLKNVKNIALVGASDNPHKASHRVLKDLSEKGYRIFPVNPRPGLQEIAGLPVFDSLADIDEPVDMVDVFRPASELPAIAEQAVAMGARVLWGQLDIVDEQAAAIAREAGLAVIMDRCPSIELAR